MVVESLTLDYRICRSGKDVSDETVADAGEPLEIRWYRDSYIDLPVGK